MSDNPYQVSDPVTELPSVWKSPVRLLLNVVAVAGILVLLLLLLLPVTRSGAREAARRTQCRNNLKQIGLAISNYEEKFGAPPPICTIDEVGRPLHSWRTLILPYLEQQALYDSIDLSKRWDHPANAEAYNTVPSVYRCPSADIPALCTMYMAIAEDDSRVRSGTSESVPAIRESNSQGLMVIEVPQDKAVHWMAPVDTDTAFFMSFGEQTDFAHAGGTQAVLVNGQVDFISFGTSAAERQEMTTVP